MSNFFKRTVACCLGTLILGSSAVFLASCQKGASEPDMTVNLTAETTAPIITPAPKDSVATGAMAFNGEAVSATELDFYYYTLLSNYEQYVTYGYVPTTAEGKFDLSAPSEMEGYENMSWGETLRAIALTQVQDMHILEALAKKESMTLRAENLTAIEGFYTNLSTNATSLNMEFDAYLQTLYGTTATKATLEPIVNRYFLASQYMEKIQGDFEYTTKELEAFYTTHKDGYTNTDLPVVRHILYKAYKGNANGTDATETELSAAKANAEAALAKVTSYEDMVSVGDAALNDASAAEAAEYTVQKGQMVEAFDTWCFDAARKVGDKAIVQTEFGYHVMYFVGSQKDWYEDAVAQLKNDKYKEFMEAQEKLPEFALKVS